MAMNNTNNPLKKNPLGNFSDPKKTGVTALILAVVSLFIFGAGLSIAAIVMGVFGVYNGIKLKAGTGAILINVLAIVVGIASKIMLEMFVNS